ncbi:DUF1763-domain-containing protein [Daldinia caldariorum]|uniref:DUF1763-domain-containing protein n=1 Tax=Daldinia caldariorum TaxID=326644 RepID=UPI0020087C9B|nr:DUF1763-domain-containing protein [Daldinia caldariorum]KAI1471221.1 DUF1763-domain-containing protein [Daldinia caldariorum]
MTDIRIIHAYRHLYRQLLHAVKFSKPARFVARDQLRAAFRDKNAKFDPRSTTRTLRFLEAAARARGLEHNILKNLLVVAWHRTNVTRVAWKTVEHSIQAPRKQTDLEKYIHKTAYRQYDMTVAMLNKSLGLCLR